MLDRLMIALAILASMALISWGCAGTYTTDDDDTTDDSDDDAGDDDAGDDDTGDDDAGDDDVGDDDVSDDDSGDDDTGPTTSCNPWDPIDLPGASWNYQSTYAFMVQGKPQGDSGSESVSSGGSTYFQGYTVYQRMGTFTGAQYSATWYGYDNCEAGGNVDYGSFVQDNGGQVAVTTVNSPQVMYLPYNPDQQAGYSWNTNYTQMVDLSGDQGSFQANWDWTIVGVENVNVTAGNFQAAHIHATYTSEDQLGQHNGTLDTYWVKGVGLAKWDEQRPNEGGLYIYRELTSYGGPLAPE